MLGFLSGIVQLFVDVNQQVSIKWLLLSILIAGSSVLILLKVIFDLSRELKPPPPFEVPISFLPEEQLFIIRRNDNFLNSIVVGCYAEKNEIQRLAYLGVVHLVQDKVIQIKIRGDYGILKSFMGTTEELRDIVIRPVVPITAIEQFNTMENQNV